MLQKHHIAGGGQVVTPKQNKCSVCQWERQSQKVMSLSEVRVWGTQGKKKKRIQKLLQILKRKKIKVKQTVSNAKP